MFNRFLDSLDNFLAPLNPTHAIKPRHREYEKGYGTMSPPPVPTRPSKQQLGVLLQQVPVETTKPPKADKKQKSEKTSKSHVDLPKKKINSTKENLAETQL